MEIQFEQVDCYYCKDSYVDYEGTSLDIIIIDGIKSEIVCESCKKEAIEALLTKLNYNSTGWYETTSNNLN